MNYSIIDPLIIMIASAILITLICLAVEYILKNKKNKTNKNEIIFMCSNNNNGFQELIHMDKNIQVIVRNINGTKSQRYRFTIEKL